MGFIGYIVKLVHIPMLVTLHYSVLLLRADLAVFSQHAATASLCKYRRLYPGTQALTTVSSSSGGA